MSFFLLYCFLFSYCIYSMYYLLMDIVCLAAFAEVVCLWWLQLLMQEFSSSSYANNVNYTLVPY